MKEKPAEIPQKSFLNELKKSVPEENEQPQTQTSSQEQDTPTVIRVARAASTQPVQTQDEDMFKGSGAPVDQFDIPAYLRRRRGS